MKIAELAELGIHPENYPTPPAAGKAARAAAGAAGLPAKERTAAYTAAHNAHPQAREAHNARRRARYQTDPEYRAKINEDGRKAREAHPENYRASWRKASAAFAARKRAEKQAAAA